jgi:hypothetical protein
VNGQVKATTCDCTHTHTRTPGSSRRIARPGSSCCWERTHGCTTRDVRRGHRRARYLLLITTAIATVTSTHLGIMVKRVCVQLVAHTAAASRGSSWKITSSLSRRSGCFVTPSGTCRQHVRSGSARSSEAAWGQGGGGWWVGQASARRAWEAGCGARHTRTDRCRAMRCRRGAGRGGRPRCSCRGWGPCGGPSRPGARTAALPQGSRGRVTHA